MGKYAILIVSALIFSMITYSHGLRNALFISNARTVDSYSQNQAHNIAQSAAMMAIRDLRGHSVGESFFHPDVGYDVEFPQGAGFQFQDWSDMYGSFRIVTTNQNDQLLRILSTGRFEDTEYTVDVGLGLNQLTDWHVEIFQSLHANENLNISNANGGNICGDVTFNGDYMHLGNNNTQEPKIDGDLQLANGYDDVTIAGRETHVGGDISQGSKLDFPMPEFPHDDYDAAKLSGIRISNMTYNGGSHTIDATQNLNYIDEMVISGNSTITIQTGGEGDVSKLFVGNMDIQASDIIIEGDGKLELYVESEFNIGGNAEFNKQGDVNSVKLFYRGNPEIDLVGEDIVDYGGEIQITGTTQFNGSLFAYNADLVLNGTAGITGDIMTGGSSVTIHGNPQLESEISRLIYAPLANVVTSGNPKIYGSVISNSFSGGGGFTLCYDGDFDTDGFDLEVLENYGIVYWN